MSSLILAIWMLQELAEPPLGTSIMLTHYHTLTPLKRTLERLSRQMSVKKYNELLRSDLNEIGKAFSLDRQERTYYFHLWKSRTEQRTMDHQDVQHAYKDATPSGVASLLEIGLRIDMEDKMYKTGHRYPRVGTSIVV